MTLIDCESAIRDELQRLRAASLCRHRRAVQPIDSTHVEFGGRRFVNFSSNDYLGLTRHPRVVAAARSAIARDGAGSAAAPLITGRTPAHASAERVIADWKQTASAVLLSSGFQANVAAVHTMTRVGQLAQNVDAVSEPPQRSCSEPISPGRASHTRFLLDKLCHASLINAVRGGGQSGQGGYTFRTFPHNDLAKLDRMLTGADPRQLQVVVSESVFSMDGDCADLLGLAELKRQHRFLLILDEAHASGVYGPAGSGLAGERGTPGLADVSVVTLSKALGASGGAVCASDEFCELLVNCARPYIYSTSLPSSSASAAEAAIEVLRLEPHRQSRVRELARDVRSELIDAGFVLPTGDSPIIPVILGAESAALEAAASLEEAGLLVVPVRPPTVARGSSRLRITLSCDHTDDEIRRLVAALRKACPTVSKLR